MTNDWRNARIEEAAKAMHADDLARKRANEPFEYMNPETLEWYRDNARAALAVFEKALGEATVTPTNDSMSHYADPTDPFWQSNPEPQGEPSDAQVGAAMNAVVTYYQEQGHLTRPESVDYQALRAALRAAFSLREGGVR